MQGREIVRTLHQCEDPNPTQPTRGMKKKIKSEETERKSGLGKQIGIGSALKTSQSLATKHRVIKIVPQRNDLHSAAHM